MTEEELAHVGDDPLPRGLYGEADAAIVRYARRSTREIAIDRGTYDALAAHFSTEQLVEISFLVGLANLVHRLNATFLTDVDEFTVAAVEEGDRAAGACPVPRPPVPVD